MVLRFHREIHLSNLDKIQEKLIDRIGHIQNVGQHYPDRKLFLDIVELIDDLVDLGYDIDNTIFGLHFSPTTPLFGNSIHIDNPSPAYPDYSFNIPIQHCANTFLNFFETTSEPICIPTRIINGVQYRTVYVMEPKEPVLLASIDASRPVLIRIKVPHNISNPNPTMRTVLLVRSTDDQQVSGLFDN